MDEVHRKVKRLRLSKQTCRNAKKIKPGVDERVKENYETLSKVVSMVQMDTLERSTSS